MYLNFPAEKVSKSSSECHDSTHLHNISCAAYVCERGSKREGEREGEVGEEGREIDR
jgi:hypothetical protein